MTGKHVNEWQEIRAFIVLFARGSLMACVAGLLQSLPDMPWGVSVLIWAIVAVSLYLAVLPTILAAAAIRGVAVRRLGLVGHRKLALALGFALLAISLAWLMLVFRTFGAFL